MHNTEILQGLNLESEYSTVKIPLTGQYIDEITTLLEKISAFHPIFIHEYIISPTELTIRSKLPFVWRECADTFQKLSTREITLKKADEYIIETIIKKRIKSMSTIPLLYSAHKSNIETTPLLENIVLKDIKEGFRGVFNRYYVMGSGKGNQITGSISSTKDAYLAQNIQKDKWSTNTVIQRLNLPMPKWEIISNITELEECWSEYEKPVVIKPTGLVGGHGVVVGLNTLEEAKIAFKFAVQATQDKQRSPWQKKIMIQEQVKGEDYRLLVIGGKLEIATKRIPAFITGDGKHTIEELIIETNKDPRRDTSNPGHILKPIIIDSPLKSYIKEQGYTLESIPQKDIDVFLRKIASMSQGGVTQDFTDSVSREIKILVETIAQSLHAFTLGVDVMCLDLSKPLTKDNGAILEVNTMPESYLNFYPTIGKQREYVADIYIERLLRENISQKLIVIGQTENDLPTLLRKKWGSNKDDVIGELKGNDYVINGRVINDIEDWNSALDALKCNGSLDILMVHYRDWNDVQHKGLGFDHINTVYITKEMYSNKEYVKILKRYKRMRLIDKIKKI
jgi:D-alanine-D-alanine ligase-like ATP-grasp enzyme